MPDFIQNSVSSYFFKTLKQDPIEINNAVFSIFLDFKTLDLLFEKLKVTNFNVVNFSQNHFIIEIQAHCCL